jgi:hypothetical protein
LVYQQCNSVSAEVQPALQANAAANAVQKRHAEAARGKPF